MILYPKIPIELLHSGVQIQVFNIFQTTLELSVNLIPI